MPKKKKTPNLDWLEKIAIDPHIILAVGFGLIALYLFVKFVLPIVAMILIVSILFPPCWIIWAWIILMVVLLR